MAATYLDAEAYHQLLVMGQQYAEVEKEKNTLTQELKSCRKRRRQLVAEVRFLHAKLRSFRTVPELDGPSQAARHHLKSTQEPQFYEVEVQFAEALDKAQMDSRLQLF